MGAIWVKKPGEKKYSELTFTFQHDGSREALELAIALKEIFGKYRLSDTGLPGGIEARGILLKYSRGCEIRLICPDGSYWMELKRIRMVVESIIRNSRSDEESKSRALKALGLPQREL